MWRIASFMNSYDFLSSFKQEDKTPTYVILVTRRLFRCNKDLQARRLRIHCAFL